MRRLVYDWKAVQAFFDAGYGFVACQKLFGFSHTAWIKAIQRGRLHIPKADVPYGDRRRKYDWAAIQAYYDEGHSYRECLEHFKFSPTTWTKAVQRGELTARARQLPLSRILAESRSRTSIKRRLLEAGLLKNACDECGLTEWRGRALSIQIDHRNGIRDDHRLENLRMLCPNCHSQTETFGARNLRFRKSFPGRLMVGQQPLKLLIGVRVSTREPRPYRLEA
jgi:hypothetical protein